MIEFDWQGYLVTIVIVAALYFLYRKFAGKESKHKGPDVRTKDLLKKQKH